MPARKGSKGVPDKNIKPLGGKSLIERALRCGLSIGGQVVLSTDYALPTHALHGVIVSPRPPNLATDTTSMWRVLSFLHKELHYNDTDVIVLLQPTSLHEDRAGIVKMMLKEGVLPCCTVDRVPDRWHPWYAQSTELPHDPPSNRQRLPARYRPNGLVYIFTGASARKESFWGDHPKFYEVGGVINIDTPEDWAEAERAYGHL